MDGIDRQRQAACGQMPRHYFWPVKKHFEAMEKWKMMENCMLSMTNWLEHIIKEYIVHHHISSHIITYHHDISSWYIIMIYHHDISSYIIIYHHISSTYYIPSYIISSTIHIIHMITYASMYTITEPSHSLWGFVPAVGSPSSWPRRRWLEPNVARALAPWKMVSL